MINNFYIGCLGTVTLCLSAFLAFKYSIPTGSELVTQYYVTNQTSFNWFNQPNSNVWNSPNTYKFNDSNETIFDPSQYRKYNYSNLLSQEDKELYKTIKDYTLKMSMPCQSGTGWILDFEIPENKDKYPTKWFIATNLHVINHFRFKFNPYNAILPIDEKAVFYYSDQDATPPTLNQGPTYRINRNFNIDHFAPINPLETPQGKCLDSLIENNAELTIYRHFDWAPIKWKDPSISRSRNGAFYNVFEGLRTPQIAAIPTVYYAVDQYPKLVFSAVDFLGPRYYYKNNKKYQSHYFKDFSVVEFNFHNENDAKIMTNGFYDKYYKDPKYKDKRINIFSPELLAKDSHEEIAKLGKYYVGGYPGNSKDNVTFDINSRWDTFNNTKTESRLDYMKYKFYNPGNYFPLTNKHKQRILGHINLDLMSQYIDVGKTKWSNKTLLNWGYAYMISNIFLQQGTSGSLTIDKDRNLLGLYSMNGTHSNSGYVESIRSNGIFEDNKIILPKYDLITGVDGQLSSYRSNLLTSNPNIKTFLSDLEWGNKLHAI